MENITSAPSVREVESAWKSRKSSIEHAKRKALITRDIGPTPMIADIDRREACRNDFALFCKTYNPNAFYLESSPIHEMAIDRISECVTQGAMYCYAMPRGSGKTTLAKMAAWWALSYSHRKYVYLIGATGDRAIRLLESIRVWCRFNRPYIDDFPEISVAIRGLNGRGNGAAGQTQNGRSTMIGWTKESLIMPTVSPAPNWNYADYGYDEMPEFAITSGAAAACSGLTGDGIRGNVITTSTGDELRPDFVIADDPQTDRSARSPTQNFDRYDLMTGAVLGMAGPDKTISLLMPCTIIRQGDMVSRCLDRKESPLFRGMTTSILTTMPENLDLWEPYFEKYQYGMLQEPPTLEYANKYYLEHREQLDAGCEATWESRMLPGEISAIQSAMNLYCRDRKVFFAEYMNQPVDLSEEKTFLNAAQIVRKQHNYKRAECPVEVTKVVVFCDVQKEFLIWSMVGFAEDFTGYLLDYGTFPEQPTRTWSKSKSNALLTTKHPELSEDGRVYRAITDMIAATMQMRVVKPDGGEVMQVDAIGIDIGYKRQTVLRAIRDSRDSRVVPVRGMAVKPNDKPMDHTDNVKRWTSAGRRLGPGWRMGDAQNGVRIVQTEPSRWKTFLHERLCVPIGETGSFSLYKESEFHHHLIASHLTSEFRQQVEGKYGQFDIWSIKPGSDNDNDWLDCLSNCCMLASYLGISAVGAEEIQPRHRRKKMNASAWGSSR
jgi:hypothetical protein